MASFSWPAERIPCVLISISHCIVSGLKPGFGQPVDSKLLEFVLTEVAELKDLVKFFKEDTEDILVNSNHNISEIISRVRLRLVS